MDNKEQARVKAEAKCLRYAYAEMCVRIRPSSGRFEIVNYDNEVVDTYKFADIKDGDACLCDDNSYKNLFYYYNDAFYDGFRNGRFQDECTNVTLIKKTGFNILEHLEEK